MRHKFFLLTLFFLCLFSKISFGQTSELKLDAEKIKIFTPYLVARHGFTQESFEEWKSVNKVQYARELWYFSESFYIKKNHLKKGVELNLVNIDISRYESHRKADQEFILELPGFCDALVLLPSNKLIYKP